MKRLLLFAALMAALSCLLAGCTTYWYQEGKTFEECKQDQLMCYEELKKYSPDLDNTGRYEFKFMQECMRQKGYRLVPERSLHVSVKRQPPDLEIPWQVHGVSGFLPNKEPEQ
jgi:hypothetical protein